jgi:hypothetical protein
VGAMKKLNCTRLIKLDIDNVPERFFEVQKILHFLIPFYIRVSGGKKGLHLLKVCDKPEPCEDLGTGKACDWILDMYDDPRRRTINKVRERYGLTSDILFDIKSYRNVRLVAGQWWFTDNSYDAERIIDYWRV